MYDQKLILKSPQLEQEWLDYYDLRWRILRAPWKQPRGSEKDEAESNAYHLMATAQHQHQILGVGRIHQINAQTAQIRYMATSETSRGRGVGSKMLKASSLAFNTIIETAQRWDVSIIVLNAREEAVPFYQRNGYRIIATAETLFGEIPHTHMEKRLIRASTEQFDS